MNSHHSAELFNLPHEATAYCDLISATMLGAPIVMLLCMPRNLCEISLSIVSFRFPESVSHCQGSFFL
jgi:hypothetical protein